MTFPVTKGLEFQSVPASIRSMPMLWPIAAAALFIVGANLFFLGFRLCLPYPVSAWEAGIVTDAWRVAQGEPIYSLAANHATTMYGPLTTMLLGWIFEITGPMLQAERFVNASCGVVLVVLIALLCGARGWLPILISAALLLAANSRTSYYFTETRPDMVAALLGTVALVALYRAIESERRTARIVLASAGAGLLVVAVLFKQTAVAFAFVPLLAELGRLSGRGRLFLAATPIIAVAITGAIVWRYAPGVWHFMVEVPLLYDVSPGRTWRYGLEFVAGIPLFVLAMLHWLLDDAPANWQTPRARWLMAAVLGGIGASLLAFAKSGGGGNSLIPALLAIGAFCTWRLPALLASGREGRRLRAFQLASGFLLGILLLAHAYPEARGLNSQSLRSGYGGPDRSIVVTEARRLAGKVISPDDPTIALEAKGYAGRTAVFEADAIDWDWKRALGLIAEIDSADVVITMNPGRLPNGRALVTAPYAGNLDWWPKADFLAKRGFASRPIPGDTSSVYEIWERQVPR